MKLGERVRHVGWSSPSYGEIVELLPDGRCSVVYPNGSSFSGIKLEAIKSVEAEIEQKRRDQARQDVIQHLEAGDLATAQAWYDRECADWWPLSEFEAEHSRCNQLIKARQAALREQRELERRRKLKRRVVALVDAENFEEADRLHSKSCKDWWPLDDYETLKRHAMYALQFADVYRVSSLADLDNFFKQHQGVENLPINDYVALKLPRVERTLRAMGITLDYEQLCAVARPEDRLLITARAGSGKTRTLCARAALSIHDEGLYPDQVMILAFNKLAALTVKERLEESGHARDYRNARTFHSLAYQLVKPRKKLLFDEGGEPSKRDQSRFAQRMMQRILNPAFKEAMVDFFRQELRQIEDLGRDLAPFEYMIFRRSLELVTLDGRRVKSNGEKFIADFLFEHGIEYRYEKPWAWKGPSSFRVEIDSENPS